MSSNLSHQNLTTPAGRTSDRTRHPVDATARRPASGDRALVLGGGGSTGNAWLIGVVAGLVEAGLDVTDADLVIGTSAGSTAAAQLAGASPAELMAGALAVAQPRRSAQPQQSAQPRQSAPPRRSEPSRRSDPAGHARPGPDRGQPAHRATEAHLERMRALVAASVDAADLRRRVGAAALVQDGTSEERRAQWRATVAARLPRQEWPERTILITAVDADTGEPVVFDRYSGVDLADAVAASCSSGVAYRIGDRRYVDGGYRSNAENADLAAGHARVLVLSPLGGRALVPVEWGTHLAAQVEELRAAGSRVEILVPDSESEHLFGANAMNGSLRPAAARAGYDLGRARAAQLTELWG